MRIRKHSKKVLLAVALGLALGTVATNPANAGPSQNVAYINSLSVYHGGAFPSTTAPFTPFNFVHLPYNNADFAAALAPNGICGPSACDTVLLNVSSTGLYCNVNNLTAQAKAALVSFVSNGGKLIISDSECSSQDYSWLPYPFTTNNPGARGGRGTVHIVEDNGLSTEVGDPTCLNGDPLCINATTLGQNTDAVGDMNVMTSLDANWCLDMSGTNTLQQTGPTHTYARYGNGLLIYNGFDLDVMNTNTLPVNTAPAGNLAKIWLQELQVEFNPTPFVMNGQPYMPCGIAVVGITQAPLIATNDLTMNEDSHKVTATLKDQTGTPQPNVQVTFNVIAGPNSGAIGTCSSNPACFTDANGQVSFTYDSNGSTGTDTIHTCFTPPQGGQPVCAQDAKKEWVKSQLTACDTDGDGDIDKIDLSAISRARGQAAQPGDPRDANNDGTITPLDVKVCIPQCTLPGCAVQ